jgi:iron(III) transport system substrate-binding protein
MSTTECPKRWIGLIVAAVGLAVWPGCVGEEVPEARIKTPHPPLSLVVVTPHNERIQEKFEVGFTEWHAGEYKRVVNMHWVTRGTPQCQAYIQEATASSEIITRRMVPDLMFGGGITDHRWLIERGLARPISTPLAEEEPIPASLLGVPLRDEQGYWHATALTSFGIFCNRQACVQRGLSLPKTWGDLAQPAYYGWVALADPTRSGSNRFCLSLVLQRYGWDEGWGLVLRMAANARTLLPGSEDVIDGVASGMCLAGPSVNFNAQHRAMADGGERLAFIEPADAGAITPDVMTVLTYGSSPDVAERFMRYCLSEQGQALWSLGDRPAEESAPAVAGEPLYRYPVQPTMYDKYAGWLLVESNPFERDSDFLVDMALEQRQARIIAPLLLAACGENHVLLQRAWGAIIDAGLPTGPLAELTRPPFDEQTAYELGVRYDKGGDEARALADEWAGQFRAKYWKVLKELGKDK